MHIFNHINCSHCQQIYNIQDYSNGDYNFDPLQLMPLDSQEKRLMVESELNNGRLAMIAFVGMICQEYVTGIPVSTSAMAIFSDITNLNGDGNTIGSDKNFIQSLLDSPRYIKEQLPSL